MRIATRDQDRVFAKAFAVLEDAVAARAFPGAALAVTRCGELVAHRGVGRFTYDAASPAVTAETIYDLASVSKVAATTAMAMILYERGFLDLDAPLAGLLPEFAIVSPDDINGACRSEVSLRMLLAHTSGLPGYERLFEQAHNREQMRRAACALPLSAIPGARAEYSDIGFILLGLALEQLAGEALDRFCRREIFAPLGMTETTFNPPPQWRSRIPPTEDDRRWRGRVIRGEVQDENAAAMGGVSGHAGAFAQALDVARFAECMLAGGAPILRPETIALFTERISPPAGASRALGWDTPSQPSQSGRYFSPHSFGHLGYAGTSLWIDPERRISITLLTNRTWPDRHNQAIKQVRPRFHDAVMEILVAGS